MSTRARVVCIQEPVFNIPVMVVWGATSAQFNKVMKRVLDLDVEDMLTGEGVFFAHDTEAGTLAIIGLTDVFRGTPENYGILTHELLHLVFHMLKDRGVFYTAKSEETFTYLLAFLLSTLASEMLKTEARIEARRKKRK
jgi:hypothetical protein